MTAGLLLVTHEQIGNELLKAARAAMGDVLNCEAIPVFPDVDPDRLSHEIQTALQQLDTGDGVLILCDLFGATPCNRSCLAQSPSVRVITGCNLSMVLKVFNYAHLDLTNLAQKALDGGQNGILAVDS